MRGWFDGPPQELNEQLDWLAAQPLNSAEKILQIVERLSVYDAGATIHAKPDVIRSNRNPKIWSCCSISTLKIKGTYCICDCPNCGEREAFFYLTGDWISCNRQRECKFSMSIDRYLEQHRNGIDVETPEPTPASFENRPQIISGLIPYSQNDLSVERLETPIGWDLLSNHGYSSDSELKYSNCHGGNILIGIIL